LDQVLSKEVCGACCSAAKCVGFFIVSAGSCWFRLFGEIYVKFGKEEEIQLQCRGLSVDHTI
jgi:hypothetical protein